MEHITRICRIISNPSGNAMLIGVGGSGKQSLTRLAAFICGMEVKQLSVTSRFKVDDLKESLKDMYKMAGVKGIPLVFLMTDSQIINDRFLIYINAILSSGWISDLFAKDEMEGLLGGVRNEAKAQGVPDTPETLLAFLISRIRSNLHVVLAFSPVGQTFRVRARRFPAIINCTAIDFFHSWPRDALISVAQRFLEEVELGSEAVRDQLAIHMAEEHLSVMAASERYLQTQRRYNYVTPKSYLELIGFYKYLLEMKRNEAVRLIDRLDVGLSTLRKTAADVAELQIDLTHTMVRVEEKKAATDALIEEMGVQRADAEVQQAAASVEAEKVGDRQLTDPLHGMNHIRPWLASLAGSSVLPVPCAHSLAHSLCPVREVRPTRRVRRRPSWRARLRASWPPPSPPCLPRRRPWTCCRRACSPSSSRCPSPRPASTWSRPRASSCWRRSTRTTSGTAPRR